MKLLFCQSCGDIVAPFSKDNVPRWCDCHRHAVWWIDGQRGVLRVHDIGATCNAAYVLGVSNSFLMYPDEITATVISKLHEDMPETYLFKRIGSPIVRIRPGASSDTAWSELPRSS